MSLKGSYIETEHYKITDTIGVPHTYTIGPKHVAYGSDHCSGMLNEECIRGAEAHGNAHCMHLFCNMAFDDHETALVVECYADFNASPEYKAELDKMLKANVNECERNGYAGFAFVAKF